jgi:hypothetical protein
MNLMVKSYRHARRIGCTPREALRLAFLLAKLSLHDPPKDIWGRPAAWARPES